MLIIHHYNIIYRFRGGPKNTILDRQYKNNNAPFPSQRCLYIYIDISYFNIMHNTIINGSPERLKYHFIIFYYFIVIINIIQSDRF